MSRFLNPAFASLKEYVPGEQPQDMQYLKLNTNESPFPASPAVQNAITADEVANLRLYSDPESARLKKALAEYYGVKSENIFVSNGSDEILSFAFLAFFTGSVKTLFPDITYGFYRVFGDLYHCNYEMIPLEDDFTINAKKYCGTDANTVIANPNAPTGICLPLCDIEMILKANPSRIVLIDEAYIDFGAESCYRLCEKYKNLLVVRTYSKSFSMAGARLGYAIADKEIIADLEKIKFSTNPYNLDRLTQLAGVAAINDAAYYMNNCRTIAENREYTTAKLREFGLSVLESKANFIFAKPGFISGGELYKRLKKRGILVRHFDSERIADYLRITIGTREQMNRLIENIISIKTEAEKE